METFATISFLIFFFDKSFRKFRSDKRFIFPRFGLKKEYLLPNNYTIIDSKRFQANASFVLIQVDSQSILPLRARESLLHALSGPVQLPVCNYRRETRAKWVLNEKLSTLAARLQWNFRLDGKCNPLSFAEVASFPRSYILLPQRFLRSSVPSETSRFQTWKYSLLRVNTPIIFIFSKHPLLSFSWNILTNFRNVSKRNKISRSKWDNIVSMRRVLEAGPLFHFPFFGRRPITWAERERERGELFLFLPPPRRLLERSTMRLGCVWWSPERRIMLFMSSAWGRGSM